MRHVLITGANGFIGRNLKARLREQFKAIQITELNRGDDPDDLRLHLADCDAVFHLAGINRPDDPSEFYRGNADLTETLTDLLIESRAQIPVIFTSSRQVERENDYGKSKLQAETHLRRYENSGGKLFIFRLANVFGKWCRPNYNSVIATFCHNFANALPIQISDPAIEIDFIYVDDVIDGFIHAAAGELAAQEFYHIAPQYRRSLGEIAAHLEAFKDGSTTLRVPDVSDPFQKKLHATFLTYLPENQFSYKLVQHRDDRGDFVEIIKSDAMGQVSFSTTKPGIVRGNHHHHTKVEKYLVLRGKGRIQFRHIESDELITYDVTGDVPEVVDIPPGYTHSLENTGDTEMLTLFWANEIFDRERPDTVFNPVKQDIHEKA